MKKWGIIGALLFVAACVVGFIFNFDGSDIVAIGLAAFAVTAIVVASIKKRLEKCTPKWQIAVVTVLALGAGVLVCIGGVSDNIFCRNQRCSARTYDNYLWSALRQKEEGLR